MIPDDFSMQVGIPLDDDGYLDRECPNEAGGALFKILADDWKEKVCDEDVFCPFCIHTSGDASTANTRKETIPTTVSTTYKRGILIVAEGKG